MVFTVLRLQCSRSNIFRYQRGWWHAHACYLDISLDPVQMLSYFGVALYMKVAKKSTDTVQVERSKVIDCMFGQLTLVPTLPIAISMWRQLTRCTSIGEFEVEAGTRGLRYARVATFEDNEEAELAAATEAAAARRGEEDSGGSGYDGGVRARSQLTADDVLGVELRELADRTAAAISA